MTANISSWFICWVLSGGDQRAWILFPWQWAPQPVKLASVLITTDGYGDLNSMPISRVLLSCHHLSWSANSFITWSLFRTLSFTMLKRVRNWRGIIQPLAWAISAVMDALKPSNIRAVWKITLLFGWNFKLCDDSGHSFLGKTASSFESKIIPIYWIVFVGWRFKACGEVVKMLYYSQNCAHGPGFNPR